MTDEQILALAKGSDTVDFYLYHTTKEQAEDFASQVGEPEQICGTTRCCYRGLNDKYRAIAFYDKEGES